MNYTIKNILVPTDFSECANNALRVAVGMATRHNAVLHIIHSIEPILFGRRTYNTLGSIIDIQASLITTAYENLSKHKQKIVAYQPLSVETLAETGTVAGTVSNYIDNNAIDLVVMGTHGAKGFKEYFSGTNTYEVIKSSGCPVISIPLSFDETGFNRILFPLRNVEGVKEKYDYIKPIISKNDATVHLVGIAYEDDMQDMYILSKHLKSIRDAIQHNNEYISYETYQVKDIAVKILEIAHERMDDLMIVNATLNKKWYSFLSNNFTQQIVNHCKIPVLYVKPDLTPEIAEAAKKYLIAEAANYCPITMQPI